MADVILDARDAALTGLFDDASMFPPSRLEPEEALEAHLIRRGDDRGWLLGRLVVPVHAADELHRHLASADVAGRPVDLAVVLGRLAAGTSGASVTRDLAALTALLADDQAEVTSVELTIAGRQPDEEVAAVLAAVDAAALPTSVTVTVELAVGDRAPGEVVRMLEALAGADGDRRIVARARFGGLGSTPAPGDVELAGFLLACASNRIAARIGPGLALPLRSARRDGPAEHGILNVLAAAVMAYQGARLPRIEGVLTAPADAVRLGSGALIVGDVVVESDVLASCRSDFFLSIGCADLDEPIAGLADLGVLQRGGARS